MYMLLAEAEGAEVALLPLDAAGLPQSSARLVRPEQLAEIVREVEARRRPRWVWERAQHWYPALLAAGVSLERCHDLALCRPILAGSEFTLKTSYPREYAPTEEPLEPPVRIAVDPAQGSLFTEFDRPVTRRGQTVEELSAELQLQLKTVSDSQFPARLQLLLAAESAGALVAAEMQYAGVPWRVDLHEKLLEETLGPRPTNNNIVPQRPAKMEALVREISEKLGSAGFNPDSPQELIRALHRAGIEVKTTRSWELEKSKHPAIAPLLAYKKLSRLFSANGWAWLDQWVLDGRFRPEYVVGGVVSGRWASRGGGALQIPKQVRGAVHADPGYKLIVADAAQLEPRVLTALAQDRKMAEAAQDHDLYTGIAAQGFGGDRSKAKIALLGAMYGATTGESGRLMPQLSRTYPRAVGLVEAAARSGERGEIVTTRLGRSCPAPSERWLKAQRTTTEQEQRWADNLARSRGRFTRNFVVQGSAAEWASCWLAELRRRLRARPELAAEMVFFLHDEVMVHCPETSVTDVSLLVEEAASAAKELLFGNAPINFPVSLAVVDHYDQAK
ncbi:bifunctional 3'-5' exonuclease/DNA polymerase [Psychromicrobium lacuslunae]|uniref:DNA-directed DNA polymerase n=1 Tax=Psychromicrobium lacuslunae TaxID=1618207 RepID=A0A0D4C036_9MICC|nr:bifunctional 3'-5' exonuclease/DNA polymerase [Psychromicrobium lacuslunae]AJT41948.1 3'-5' exonuclease [Psychromicrobium lacuslunae]